MTWNELSVEECALLEVGLPHVSGADWGPYTEFQRSQGEIWYEFTGKGSGATKRASKNAEARCAQFAEKYRRMKDDALLRIRATQQDAAAGAAAPRH